MRFAARTNPGRREGANEDTYGALTERSLWFVADGMGGHHNGNVASGLVRATMLERSGSMSLEESIQASHDSILAAGESDAGMRDMGSTIVAVQIRGRSAHLAWVGDSRGYLLRRGVLERLTVDHSYLESLLRSGTLSESEARSHPDRNVITRALGMENAQSSSTELPLRRNDRILLCSDGLTEELEDGEIEKILTRTSSADAAADELVAHALAHGGKDNVTVIVIDYDGGTNWRLLTGPVRSDMLWPIIGGIAAALLLSALFWLARQS
jgi:serine/threonine protein phosphatase PrpC